MNDIVAQIEAAAEQYRTGHIPTDTDQWRRLVDASSCVANCWWPAIKALQAAIEEGSTIDIIAQIEAQEAQREECANRHLAWPPHLDYARAVMQSPWWPAIKKILAQERLRDALEACQNGYDMTCATNKAADDVRGKR